MIELFIENSPVKVNETFSTLLTYAIDDIRDFSAKATTFSKTIILPGTKENNQLFGNIFEVTASNDYDPMLPNKGINFNAAISAKAYIFNDNIQVFKGIVRLMEVIIDNGFIDYEVCVFGELGGFASKLGNNKLEDLDFSGYSHTYSVANIVSSWDNAAAGQGYYYPLMDYGNYSALKHDWKYKTFRPALFAKEYIDKIFTAAGYTYECDLFNTARFKSLVIPHNQKVLQKVSTDYLSAVNAASSTASSTSAFKVPYPTQPTLGSFTYSSGTFTLTGGSITGNIELNISLNIARPYGLDVYVHIYKNGASIGSQLLSSSSYASASLTVPNVTLNAADTIEVFVIASGSFNVTILSSNLTIHPSASAGSGVLVPVNIGEDFGLNTAIPQNILQKDFISSIVKDFNLYIFEDPENDRVLKIMPFVDFFANATAIDWSLKLDRSKPIRVKPMSELNARYYDFKFKEDSDYFNDLYKKRYNQSYGSLIYDSNYEFAKETEHIEVIFSGTPLVGYTGEDKVYSTIFKRTGEAVGAGEENTDCNIRLLQAKKITGVSSWEILGDDGTTNYGYFTDYGYAGHLDDPDAPANDIQFGVPKELFFTLATGALNINQFNVYWSSYMAEITDKDSRLLTGTFKLNLKDIYNLDFSKFIYLDGSFYRLNKIKDFNATNEDVCQVELLKVVNMNYNVAPVTVLDPPVYVPVSYVMGENGTGSNFRDNNIQFINSTDGSEIQSIYSAGRGNLASPLQVGAQVTARQTYFGGIDAVPVWASSVTANIKLFVNEVEVQSVTASYPEGYTTTGVLTGQQVAFTIEQDKTYRVESTIIDPLNNRFTATTNELWSNPANWSQGHVPLSTETATISSGNITLDVTTTIDKLVIGGGCVLTATLITRQLTVNNDCNVLGYIDLSSNNHALILKGTINSIPKANFTAGSNSIVIYSRTGNQDIIDLSYRHLEIRSTGVKSATANLVVAGNLAIVGGGGVAGAGLGNFLDLMTYDLAVYGTSSFSSQGCLKKTTAGNLLFVGALDFDSNGGVIWTGNPTIELRGGLTPNTGGQGWNTGSGTMRFTTNNQSFNSRGGEVKLYNAITIENIILTNIMGGTSSFSIYGSINGTTPTSRLVNNNKLYIGYIGSVMSTGIFDYMNDVNSTMGYVAPVDQTIPFTVFANLYVEGSSTKSLSGNTVLNKSLFIHGLDAPGGSILNCGNFDLTIGTTFTTRNNGCLAKSGAGTIIFTGLADINSNGWVNFAGGNPTLDFRGGLNLQGSFGLNSVFGTGPLKFTTNAQTFQVFSTPVNLYNPIIIDNIPLTLLGDLLSKTSINGTNGTSTLLNKGNIKYAGVGELMVTGVLDRTSFVNTVTYDLDGNQDIKAGTYKNLSLKTGGTKKLLGNVSVQTTYVIDGTVTLNSNGFALTNP